MSKRIVVALVLLAAACFPMAVVPPLSGYALWFWAAGIVLLWASLIVEVRRRQRPRRR